MGVGLLIALDFHLKRGPYQSGIPGACCVTRQRAAKTSSERETHISHPSEGARQTSSCHHQNTCKKDLLHRTPSLRISSSKHQISHTVRAREPSCHFLALPKIDSTSPSDSLHLARNRTRHHLNTFAKLSRRNGSLDASLPQGIENLQHKTLPTKVNGISSIPSKGFKRLANAHLEFQTLVSSLPSTSINTWRGKREVSGKFIPLLQLPRQSHPHTQKNNTQNELMQLARQYLLHNSG